MSGKELASNNSLIGIGQDSNQLDDEASGQYIAFTVEDREYCVDIMAVREIRGWTATTQIPNAPKDILGVVNLRGTVIPIMDMRTRFGLGRTEATATHVVIILHLGTRLIGILVDAVSDILVVPNREIQPVDNEDMAGRNGLVDRVVARDDRIVSMLALDRLLPGESAAAVSARAAAAAAEG